MRSKLLLGPLFVYVCFGCQRPIQPPADVVAWKDPSKKPVEAPPKTPEPPKYAALSRARFNELAVRLNLPLYWAQDTNGNQAVDPNEVRSLLFYPKPATWTNNGTFTKEFEDTYAALLAADKAPIQGMNDEDTSRLKLVVEELAQGAPTLVHNDLSMLNAPEKSFVRQVLQAAKGIDELYALAVGMKTLESDAAKVDPASQSMFRRNWGPKCVGPKTERHAKCNALSEEVKPVYDLYPKEIQKERSFCKSLETAKNAKALLDPFVAVREEKGKLVAVPYHVAYKPQMDAVATTLESAAMALDGVESEQAMRGYVLAAARSFRSNDWRPSDEAWAKMNATNSKFYLRVAPDETYWEPCSHKAGFHLTFAIINKESLNFQKKLAPVQQDMEDTLATLIGKAYKARKVTFHLPDFIDIVFNAGDDRDPIGATIGQSLPNWGPVANEGRGRTVAMSNLYTDPDSRANRHAQATSLLTQESMKLYGETTTPALLSTILHEATHNLGPAHEYAYKGKSNTVAFGGPLASMMEELKAQSGALYFIDFLRQKGIIDDQLAKEAYLDSIVWAFGHISREMYEPDHKPKTYSHVAAIQVGFLIDEGAITFDPKAHAANGSDEGSFTLHFDKLPAAIEKLMNQVAEVKATNRRDASEAWVKRYVDGDVIPQGVIRDRLLRFPKSSFVYSLEL